MGLTRFVTGILLSLAMLQAQQRTGAIGGTVTDQTGAAIESAAIRVRNIHTGLERQVLSDKDGSYLFPLLPVGAYSITASKDRFQDLVREGILVNVNEQARVDLTLVVAGGEQSVRVVADAPQVNTSDATNGAVLQSQAIQSLPLNGRNYTELGTLLPGVVATPARFASQSAAATNAFSINGQRTQSNNFLLDGVSNNDTMFNGYSLVPPPDALQQFKILTSNFSAEYGTNSGSVVNVITRSGTNQVHGSAWNYLRNDVVDARNFFSTSKPPLRQNQFGATFGAPVLTNRTFIFGYYEGLRARVGTVQNVVVLTDAQRSGHLAGASPAFVDPLSGKPFPNNVIPDSRVSPVSRALLDRYVPLPNAPGNRFNRAPSVSTDSDQYGIRGDHLVSSRNTLFLRYSYSRNDTSNPLGAGDFSPQGSSSIGHFHQAVVSDTHVFSPNVINEASISFLRLYSRPATWSGVDLADLGFQYPGTEPSAQGLPIVSLSGLFSVGDVAQSWTKLARNTYQVFDNLTWIRGRHSVKTGLDIRQQQIFLVFPNRPNGDFSFNGARSGNTIADFLLGLPAQFRQGGGDPSKHFIGHQLGFYVQDDFRVTRRLTLNFGLRYELGLPYYDKQDRLASFQPGAKSIVRPNAPENLLFPGDPGVPRGTIRTDRNNFAPRFGFAYDLTGDGRTSVRGGYGIFFDSVPGLGVFQNINVPPFNRFVQIDTPASLANPYAGLPTNPQTDPSLEFPCPCLVIGFSPDFVSPYAQHFNFGVQRQIARDLVAEIGYVGSIGLKFPGYLEVNPAIPGPGATRENTQSRRIYENYNLVRPTFSRFNSNYHSLQARLEKRFSGGLGFLTSYTWSKAIDFQSSLNFSGENRPQDAFSLSDVRGLAAFDTRHRFVTSFSYDLPLLRNAATPVRLAFGGWRLSGIISAQSGNPLTVNEPVDRSLRGLGADRPDQVKNPNNGPKTPEEWFDTSAFVRLPDAPGGQRSGTAGRNTVIGPGLLQTDLSVVKAFPLAERHVLDLRCELFNALNRTNFLNPVTNIGNPQTFGVIQSARAARIIQFALKYSF